MLLSGLTDGLLHFLQWEAESTTSSLRPASSQIAQITSNLRTGPKPTGHTLCAVENASGSEISVLSEITRALDKIILVICRTYGVHVGVSCTDRRRNKAKHLECPSARPCERDALIYSDDCTQFSQLGASCKLAQQSARAGLPYIGLISVIVKTGVRYEGTVYKALLLAASFHWVQTRWSLDKYVS